MPTSNSSTAVFIPRSQDLALGFGQWVCQFLKSGKPPKSVVDKTLIQVVGCAELGLPTPKLLTVL